eukprot:751257-Hanusia_phi.AAC.2
MVMNDEQRKIRCSKKRKDTKRRSGKTESGSREQGRQRRAGGLAGQRSYHNPGRRPLRRSEGQVRGGTTWRNPLSLPHRLQVGRRAARMDLAVPGEAEDCDENKETCQTKGYGR